MKKQIDNRAIIVSVPKAGTYLGLELLQAIGFTATNLHIQYDANAIGIYDFKNMRVPMSNAEKNSCFKPMPLEDSLAKIGNGEFAVGHLPPLREVKEKLCGNFKIIFLVRNLRDCLISHMRFMIKIGAINFTDHPWIEIPDKQERFKQYLINYAEPVGPLVQMKLISCWEFDIHDPYPGMELFKLRFEDLLSSDNTTANKTLNALSYFLGTRPLLSTDQLLKHVLEKQTLTRSDGLTIRQEYWSPFAEQWFLERIKTNGVNINEFIGYE